MLSLRVENRGNLERPEYKGFLAAMCVVGAGLVAGTTVAMDKSIYLLCPVVLVTVLRWPLETALGSFAMLLPFDSVSTVGQERGTTLIWLVGAAAVVVLLAAGLIGNRLEVPPRAAFWWSSLLSWGVVTSLWAIDPQLTFQRLPTGGALLLLYLTATSIRMTEKQLVRVNNLTIVGGCLAAVIAAVQFDFGNFYHQTTRGSLVIGGAETDPNFFAASLLLPISLALDGFLRLRGGLIRSAMLIATLLCAVGIFLSMSRGGMVALLAIVLVYLRRLRCDARICIALACLAFAVAFLPQEFFTRLQRWDNGAGRGDIWAAAVSGLPHYWLQGAGLNNFSAAYNEVAGNAPVFHGFARDPHNIYLSTLVELGVVGLAFLLLAFRSQLRLIGERKLVPYEAACWGMLVAGLFLDVIWRKFFWFCWILLVLASRLRERSNWATG